MTKRIRLLLWTNLALFLTPVFVLYDTGIKLAGDTVGTGLREFFGDKDKMVAATATLTAMALGIYTARTGTGKGERREASG